MQRIVGIAVASSAAAASVLFVSGAEVGTDYHFHVASATGPLVRLLDAETAHRFGIWAASCGLFPKEVVPDNPRLQVKLWDKTFSNPFGIAAGFDKNAEAVEGLLGMGMGFMEIGEFYHSQFLFCLSNNKQRYNTSTEGKIKIEPIIVSSTM